MNRRIWLTAVPLVVITLSLAAWLLMAGPAAAREIFRDGKWITVPDDSDIEPAAGPVQTEDPARSADQTTTQPPADAPTDAATAEPAPAPETTTPTPSQLPAAAEAPARAPHQTPVAVEQPDTTPRLSPPPATLVIEAAPQTDRSTVLVGQVQSVGAKYRNPAPSRAVAEVKSLISPPAVTEGEIPQAVQKSMELFERGKYRQVQRDTKRYLRSHPPVPFGEASRWLQAEAAFSRGQFNPARKAYDTFLDDYAGSPLADKALLRQMESAEALLGPARVKILGLPLLSGESEAIDTLHNVYGRSPTGPLASDALFRIGEYRYGKRQHVEAQEVFIRFTQEFPNHSRSRQAELLAAQSGMNAIVGASYDISTMQRSKEILERYEQKYPAVAAEEHVPDALRAIRETEALKRLEIARYYSRAGKPAAAAFYARRVVERYASTPQAAEAQALLEKTERKLAKERS